MKIAELSLILDCLFIKTKNNLSFHIAVGQSLKDLAFTLKEIGALTQFTTDELITQLNLSKEKVNLLTKKRKSYKKQQIHTYFGTVVCDFCDKQILLDRYSHLKCEYCYSELEKINADKS